MPLLKLWNSIRGKTTAESAPEPVVQPAKPSPSGQPAKSPEVAPAVAARLSPDATVEQPGSKKPTKNRSKTGNTKLGRLGRFATKSPLIKSPLIKKLKGVSATSVLEVGVGDGSRSIEVITFLQGDSENRIRYAAIDQFEMGDGQTTLMQFHQTLRAASIRPQVFPESVASGLLRVAHTLGAMDLVLISDCDVDFDSATFQDLLSRITHANSHVFRLVDGVWMEISFDSAGNKRRAA